MDRKNSRMDATFHPSIKWENMYAHRCQACIRLYADKSVREVILKNAERMVPDVVAREWLLFAFEPILPMGRSVTADGLSVDADADQMGASAAEILKHGQ